MRSRKGATLLQVIIIAGVLFALCSTMVKISLALRTTRKKAVNSIQALAELEKGRAKIWACLDDRGYPGATCTPSASQLECVPAGISAQFAGEPPDCRAALSLDI